jgi:hypothetical protein
VCVKVPDFPVTVMVNVPVLARLPTFSVSELDVVAGFGLKEAVTRFGNPEAERLTAPVNPLDGVMVTVAVPLLPRAMLRLDGEADRLKFGPGVTVSDNVVELTKLPEVPVMVNVNVPVPAAEETVIVSVLELTVLVGLKDAVTPLGTPDADRLIVPLKPFCGFTVIVLVPLLP